MPELAMEYQANWPHSGWRVASPLEGIAIMTGLIVLAVLLIAIVAVLEVSHRRNAQRPPHDTGTGVEDRDRARTRLDLLALADRAEPFAHKPFTLTGHWPRIGYGGSGQSTVRLSG